MASPPARLVISTVESQDRSFTCLNRLRSVVRSFPSLIEFSTALLLLIHRLHYRSGSQNQRNTSREERESRSVRNSSACAEGLKGGKSPARKWIIGFQKG